MTDTVKPIKISKFETGIEGLDYITGGGLFHGRTTLIGGSSGSGKTLVSLNITYNRVTKYGDKAVFVTMEEKVEDIIFNVKSLNWDFAELVAQERVRFVDISPSLTTTVSVGAINLDGLLFRVKTAIEQIGAQLVVLDSIGSLFSQFTDTALIRLEIAKVTNSLKALNVTSLITVERIEEYGPISRHGIEEFVSDNVVILRNVLEHERVRRTIQILKMRGCAHETGEYPFTISDSGFSLLPLSARELIQSSSSIRISSGNEELDAMTDGGLYRDAIILVSGPTGSGKTLLATTFAADGCRQGEKVLILAYEESQPQLLRNAQAWGLDFAEWEKSGQLKIMCLYPESKPLEHHLMLIQQTLKEFQPTRLVIDSISAMERVASVRTFREFVIGLTSYCKTMELCSLFTATTPRLSGGDSITEAHISTITDIIVLLRYVEISGRMRRGIAVIKMRGSQHDKDIHEFTIDYQGLHIGDPFENIQNIVLGVPTATATTELDRLSAMFEQRAPIDV